MNATERRLKREARAEAARVIGRALLTFAAWCFVVIALALLLASCNPYATTPTATATAQPSATQFLARANSPTPSPITCTVKTGIDSGRLNIRRGAGTSYAVIAVLREGETLRVIKRGAWIRVLTSRNITGWINSRYCKTGE